jgi:hypothetical protein
MTTGGPTQENFEKLLRWLDPVRDKAGEKHERIRLRLIRVFSSRGCYEADFLADKTINVVTSKIDWLIDNYVGDPALYFYAVGKKVFLEWIKPKPNPDLPPLEPKPPEVEQLATYLDDCMDLLLPKERDLVLRYHEFDKQEKIQYRKKLAEESQLSRNALRIKVFHIHARLRDCLELRLRNQPLG